MYATENDLLTRFAGGTAQAGDEAIGLALADATALIDTYLCKRYTLPFVEVPNIITKLCVDLACYGLSSAAEYITEDIRKRYEDAIGTLKDIAKGVIDLPIKVIGDGSGNDTGDSGNDTGVTSENGAVFVGGSSPVFGRNKGF